LAKVTQVSDVAHGPLVFVATPSVTQDLGFWGIIWGTTPFSRFLWNGMGTQGINSNPDSQYMYMFLFLIMVQWTLINPDTLIPRKIVRTSKAPEKLNHIWSSYNLFLRKIIQKSEASGLMVSRLMRLHCIWYYTE
jgi:hypothetical protein